MANILVAEDDNFLVSAYKVKLTNAGFTLEIVGDGEALLAKLTTFKPDLILLDLIMPRKDGFETLTELKKSPQYKDIPVIVASNLGQEQDVKRAKELCAQDFIVKSNMKLDDIVKMIQSYVGTA